MSNSLRKDSDYNLWITIWQVKDAIFKLRAKELRNYGISPERNSVLVAVRSIGKEATPAKIARHLLREPHSVSTLIDRMVAEGLLRKSRDLQRRNQVRVSLTKKGQEIYHKSARAESVHQVMSCLPQTQRRKLQSYLDKLGNNAFHELGIPRPP